MKICIVGDQHFRYQLPYASSFKDGRRAEWEGVKEEIYKTADKCDAVVLLGDNLNTRHNHSSVNREFVDFLVRLGLGNKPVYIISGNHETFQSSKRSQVHRCRNVLQSLSTRTYSRVGATVAREAFWHRAGNHGAPAKKSRDAFL